MESLTSVQPSVRPRPAGTSSEAFAYLQSLVLDRAAIALDDGKEYLAEARLGDMARRSGRESVWDLLLHLRSQPEGAAHKEVVEAMTTNETSFFRDPALFDAIRDAVIPDLVARRSRERRLSVWSAACSTGQEPYSMAMLLSEHTQVPASWNVRILATDLSTQVLSRARAGRFTKLEVNRGLPANRLIRWFNQMGNEWEISEELKRMVDYRQMNLVGSWPLVPPVDLVLLRNVLIYFPMETKRRVLAEIRKVLRPDGYLVLGNAETTMGLDSHFVRVGLGRVGVFQLAGAGA